jgi:IclR family pca regulon transcriptional regulator
MASEESEAFVRTFARGLKVIEAMGRDGNQQTIASISEASELPRTVVRRFLLTLAELGFVGMDGRHYWLTPKILRLGMSYLYALPFWRHAQLVLEELSSTVGQSCALSVLDEEDIVYIGRVHSQRILAMSPVLGSRFPAHAISMGRALLASLDSDKLDLYLQRAKLTRLTPWTIADREELAGRIRSAREQGYAWVDRELDESICGIAVPIRDTRSEVVGALNVSLPAGPWTEGKAVEAFLVPLRQAAARIRSVG